MKKISYLELAAIIIIQTVTPFFGICFSILKEDTGVNIWIPALLSYILGFIPILLIIYIYVKKQFARSNIFYPLRSKGYFCF